MRVLSLNLWNINEPLEARSSTLASGINRLKPDVICFQEVSSHPQFLRLQSELIAEQCDFAHHGYSFSGCWDGREEGLAILSRYPIIRSVGIPLPEFPGDMGRQAFLSELNVESRRILVANTHLAFPLHMTRERASQAAILVSAVQDYCDQFRVPSVVICGDFNDTPDSPAIQTLLESKHSLFDAFATCQPKCRGYTYSFQNPYVDRALWQEGRIDYIFAGGELQLKCCEIVFDGRKGLQIVSDHFGLLCTFGLT